MMNSNIFMYITAISAVSFHNLVNNFNEVTRNYNPINLRTLDTNWTLEKHDNVLPMLFPLCTNGSKQSPISLDTKHAVENLRLRLGLTAYDKPISGLLLNKFPTFQLTPVSLTAPRPNVLVSSSVARSFNPYADSYYALNHIQFHWSTDESKNASLHQLNNASFPMEIHFVHVNTKYAFYEQASTNPDGLLILAVLVVPSTHESYAVDKLFDKLETIPNHNEQAMVEEDNSTWRVLLPKDTSSFYRYFGSLVMPPCSESVQWIVFDERLKLGVKQLRRIRRYRFESKNVLRATTVDWAAQRRPLQALGTRVLEQSFAKKSTELLTSSQKETRSSQ